MILAIPRLPDSAWADENLAEVSVQLGKMVKHRNQSQPTQVSAHLGHPVYVRDAAKDGKTRNVPLPRSDKIQTHLLV